MRKASVKVGGVYAAKVSNTVVPVRLDEESPRGGWNGTNMKTGKNIRIKSAQRLRGPWQDDDGKAQPQATTRAQGAKGAKKADGAPKDAKGKKDATRAKTGAEGAKRSGKPSGLDAAAKVLAEASEPLTCKQIVEQAFEKGYWASDGKTPHATIYSAMIREIVRKGDAARFRKADRGKFELAR